MNCSNTFYCHITIVTRVYNVIIDSRVWAKVNAHQSGYFLCRKKEVMGYKSEICAMDKWISCGTPSRVSDKAIDRSNKGRKK